MTIVNQSRSCVLPTDLDWQDEAEVYDAILSAYCQVETSGEDPAIAGGHLIVQLSRKVKDRISGGSQATHNMFLLALALFFPPSEGVDLEGRDIAALDGSEIKWARVELEGEFFPI